MSAAVEMFPRLAPAVSSCWYSESTFEGEEWLVRDLIPARSYSVMFARFGAGKSFLAWHLACCGVSGRPFLGASLDTFGTLYAVGEKGSRFGKRVEAWKRAFGEDDLAVRVRYAVPNLLDPDSVSEFIAEVQALRPEFDRRGAPLRLIVLDTLARCLKHANVSDPDAAGSAIEALQRIVSECHVAVLPLGHVAKAEGSDSAKGAGEWGDAADTLLRIDREPGTRLRTLTVAKQSDGEDGKVYAFELEVVDLGETPNGQPIRSCVVRDAEAPPSGTKTAPVKLSAAAALILSALGRASDAGQLEPVPMCPGVRPGTLGLRVAVLRSAAYAAGLQKASEPEPQAPEVEKRRWCEARKKAFQRGLDTLETAKKVRLMGDFVWLL